MTMKYIKKIVDVATGEETFEPYTAQEIAEAETAQAQSAAATAERDAEQAVKDAARQIILDKLGLTQEEASLLLS